MRRQSSPARTVDLVLEGGGVKGTALAGAAAALEEAGYRFHRIAGVSVGALVAALLAAGVGARDLYRQMMELDYARLRQPTPLERLHAGRLGLLLSEIVDEGLYSGDSLRDLVAQALRGTGVETFADLRLCDPELDAAVEVDARYKLVVIAADISRQRLVRIPWDLRREYGIEPSGMAVADAVRMSTAIPFFFVPARLRSRLTGQESYLVDGGLVSSFPLGIFDRTDGRPARWPTLRIGLSSGLRPTDPAPEIAHRLDLVKAVVHTGLHGRINAERDDPSVADRTITVDTGYVEVTDFSIGPEIKQRLFDDGYRAAQSFLAGNHFGLERPATPPATSSPRGRIAKQ